MEKVTFTQNGQWSLHKSDEEDDMPKSTIHYSDGSKKSFPYKVHAESHLHTGDYFPHKDGTFRHQTDPSKHARIETYNPGKDRIQNQPKTPQRRASDK